MHRFAITYHRKLRSKKLEHSVLDEIEGIGPKRRKALLAAFGSVEEIKKITAADDSVERLARVDGMDRRAAEKVIAFFKNR